MKSRMFWVYTHRTGSRSSNRHMYTHVLSSAPTVAQRRKQPEWPLTDGQINRGAYIRRTITQASEEKKFSHRLQ